MADLLRLCLKIIAAVLFITITVSTGFANQSPFFRLLTNGRAVTLYEHPERVYYLLTHSNMLDIETHGKGTISIIVKSLMPVTASAMAGFDVSVSSGNKVQYYTMPASGTSKLDIVGHEGLTPSEKELDIHIITTDAINVYQIMVSANATYGALITVSFNNHTRPEEEAVNNVISSPPPKPYKQWFSITPVVGGGVMYQDNTGASSEAFMLSARLYYGVLRWFKLNVNATTEFFNSTYMVAFNNSTPSTLFDQGNEETNWIHGSMEFKIVSLKSIKLWLDPGYAYLWSTYNSSDLQTNYDLQGPSLGIDVYTNFFPAFNPEISADFVYGTSANSPVSSSASIQGSTPQYLTGYSIAVPVVEFKSVSGHPDLYVNYAGNALAFDSYTRFVNNIGVCAKFKW